MNFRRAKSAAIIAKLLPESQCPKASLLRLQLDQDHYLSN